ncbi:MAG: hypothetical protein WB677_17120 [Xanthobacteraceae bacterium]
MLNRLHPIAGVVGFVTILTFWLSTVTAELFGSMAVIAAVKEMIPWGFLVLVPALAIAGASGFRLAGASSDPRIVKKRRRMPFIAANGILILVPAALYLATLASRGEFGTIFYAVQAIELVAGAVNITLMALNIRDGLSLAANRRGRRPPTGQFATNA